MISRATAMLAIILLASSPAVFAQDAVIFFSSDQNSFSATGNWAPSDPRNKPAFPSETQIDCFRDGMLCVEATAEYSKGHPHVALNYFAVSKWDKDGIIATNSSPICMAVTLQISFTDKRVSVTHSAKELDEENKGACKLFSGSTAQEDVFVLRGSARWNREHGAA
jgi:hypothetical protein